MTHPYFFRFFALNIQKIKKVKFFSVLYGGN